MGKPCFQLQHQQKKTPIEQETLLSKDTNEQLIKCINNASWRIYFQSPAVRTVQLMDVWSSIFSLSLFFEKPRYATAHHFTGAA